MSSFSEESQNLLMLLQEYFGGTISGQDLNALEGILREDPGARQQLRQFAVLEEGLADYAATTTATIREHSWSEISASNTIANRQPESSNRDTLSNPAWQNGWRIMGGTLAVTTAVALIVFLIVTSSFFDKKNSAPERMTVVATDEEAPKHTFVANLIEEIDSQFENPDLDASLGFKSGNYVLTNGSIHLRFENGADFILESPARFEILDDISFRLHDGRLRAIFPPDAQGFRVLTPGVDYHDLDAEVGVYADSSESRSDLHVFHGKVSSSLPGSSNRLDVFDARQAVIYRNGVREQGVFDDSKFLEPGEIGFQRWQRLQSRLRADPDVIGYYTFSKTTRGTVPNQAHVGTKAGFDVMSDGRIRAATWVAGRWSEKRALMFEMEGDHVELEITGEFDELTYAVWMKLDRLDHSQNSILCSDGWQPGAVHWQINRYGGPWMTSFASSSTVNIKQNIPIGRWVHLASTISSKTRTAKTFLDGELVSEVQMSESIPLRPGKCRLGNWLRHVPGQEQRGLKGRVDELIVVRRSLNQEEIRDIFQRGKPANHWNTR